MSNLNLPDGWQLDFFEKHAKITCGIAATPEYVGADEGVPFLSARNVQNAKLKLDKFQHIKPDLHAQLTKKTKPAKGDLLLTRVGAGIGEAAVVDIDFEFSVYVSLTLIKCKNTLNVYYLKQVLNSPYYRYLATREQFAGGGVQNLNVQIVKRYKILIPPLDEQIRIASILEEWDTAIEKTEALIDAKERQFGWLQNTLISAISDEWTVKPLNTLSRIKKGQQLNRDTLDESGDHPVWNGGITPSGFTDKSNTAANTITISEGGNSCGFVNFCKEDFWLGGHCYAVEELDASLDPDFLFFFLKTNERRIMRLRVGSGLPNIQKKDIEKLQIQFPSTDEQKRISHTLNTAQQEIKLLKKLADHYRTQKRGLMQKLLSGEWHIKNKEVAA